MQLTRQYRRLANALLTLLVAMTVSASTSADEPRLKTTRRAITHWTDTLGDDYPEGPELLARLDAIEEAIQRGEPDAINRLAWLQRNTLLAHPRVDFDELIVLKRKRGQLGLPTNHQCNSALPQNDYDNEIALLSPLEPTGELTTLFRPKGGFYVGELDLNHDGRRLLFTMPNGRTWQIHEIDIDAGALRQVSRETTEADVDNFDPCYLPDGRIVFASTGSFTGVPCWHGRERACSLFSMQADGSAMRQLCFDQDLDLHPAVTSGGQVVYSRWDYTGIMHMYLRPLMVMNPDGTGQRAVYGSSSYYPNSLFFPSAVPGSPNKLAAILSGYHGPNRMGELVLLDLSRGWHEAEGIVHRFAHADEPPEPVIRDHLIDESWPKFLHPHPLCDELVLTAAQLGPNRPWGIYLVDVFDNLVPVLVDGKFDFFEPIPRRATPEPPRVPDRVDLARSDAVVYLHDVHAGDGLADVPRGTIKRLRVVAYDFGYPRLAGPDKIGWGGPWEAMRILGTVPVDADGSVAFRVPANTPLTVQPLDAEGKAVQLMRSWFTVMPGEQASCVGCHAKPRHVPRTRLESAASGPPLSIEPWHGPARGFDFQREVQPVLDRHCVTCHDGGTSDRHAAPDLRAERFLPNYQGRPLSKLGAERLDPELLEYFGGPRIRYTPAYEALIPYVRRVGIEDDVEMLVAGEYHVDTSELIQMLAEGHHNVHLDPEGLDRLITWIDLNAPCHGTWQDVAPIPGRPDLRRGVVAELARVQTTAEVANAREKGGMTPSPTDVKFSQERLSRGAGPPSSRSPMRPKRGTDTVGNRSNHLAAGFSAEPVPLSGLTRTISLGNDVSLQLVGVPDSQNDSWIGAYEVTNAQYRQFDPQHESRYFMQRYPGRDGPGLSLDEPEQPVVRVSHDRAMAFCDWLSRRTGLTFTLPSEDEWEHACRAGTATPMSYGSTSADFSRHANMADRSLASTPSVTGGLTSSLVAPNITDIMQGSIVTGDIPCILAVDDQCVATAQVGRYEPNPWGLFDMHGNAAEWTRTPVDATSSKRIVRGGSFRDRPKRCTSASARAYPSWQRVHDVGFRVLCHAE